MIYIITTEAGRKICNGQCKKTSILQLQHRGVKLDSSRDSLCWSSEVIQCRKILPLDEMKHFYLNHAVQNQYLNLGMSHCPSALIYDPSA